MLNSSFLQDGCRLWLGRKWFLQLPANELIAGECNHSSRCCPHQVSCTATVKACYTFSQVNLFYTIHNTFVPNFRILGTTLLLESGSYNLSNQQFQEIYVRSYAFRLNAWPVYQKCDLPHEDRLVLMLWSWILKRPKRHLHCLGFLDWFPLLANTRKRKFSKALLKLINFLLPTQYHILCYVTHVWWKHKV